MYRNSLTPSVFFGIVLLLFSAAGMLMWLTCLADVEASAFDVEGLILLGLTLGLLVPSVLFLRRARWIRIPMSVFLHILALIVMATMLFTIPDAADTLEIVTIVAFTLLGAGLLFVGILALHNEAMKRDLAQAPPLNAARRARRRAYVVGAIVCILALLGLAAWQVGPLLVAQPTITVDYLAQANQANKPADYDPNLNAAPHYERLFAQFTPLPETLKDKWKSWPADLDPNQFKALEEWAPVNEPVLPALSQAARCSHWWFELESSDGSLSGIQTPDLNDVRDCTRGVFVLAKYKASQAHTTGAFQLLADLRMFGIHQAKGGTLVEQLTGLAVCDMSYDGVLTILDRCEVEKHVLERALDAFATQTLQVEVPRFSEVEHVYAHDSIQRLFTDDGNGNGRLIPACLYECKKNRVSLYTCPITYLDAVRICLTHPDRQETTQLFELYFAMVKELARQTPWELYAEGASYEERLEEWLSGNYYLEDGCAATAQCIRVGWRGRLSSEAMVTVLAVHLYKAQEGRLPESLKQLVDAGLLSRIPIDPYSGAPLLCKVVGDDFTLYSVGEDFVDDGGRHCDWDDVFGGDRVFWPVPCPAEAQEET